MTDHENRDQDKPIDLSNAADHRPAHADGPDWQSPSKEPDDVEGPIAKGRNQNPDAKLPNPSQIHKQQRSQGMNHSGWEGEG